MGKWKTVLHSISAMRYSACDMQAGAEAFAARRVFSQTAKCMASHFCKPYRSAHNHTYTYIFQMIFYIGKQYGNFQKNLNRISKITQELYTQGKCKPMYTKSLLCIIV